MIEARSRLSRNGRITVPKTIRKKLGLKIGDLVRFNVGDRGTATIDRVRATEGHPFAAFDEWTSDEDEALYRGL